jgi:hypothetical protein
MDPVTTVFGEASTTGHTTRRRGAAMPMPIEQYYRLHSTTARPLLDVVGRVMAILATPDRLRLYPTDQRPVVFVSGAFSPADEMYVSAGALARIASAGLAIRHDGDAFPLSELPGDLMMLLGDTCDGDAYERHKSSCPGVSA